MRAPTRRPRAAAAAPPPPKLLLLLLLMLGDAAIAAPAFLLDALGASADTVPGLPSPVPLDRSPLPRTSLLGYPEGAKFPLSGAFPIDAPTATTAPSRVGLSR